MTTPGSNEHKCPYRGCTTIVDATRSYYCDRHEAILQKRRAIVAKRNSARAAAHKARV